jgi:hypothetical protein
MSAEDAVIAKLQTELQTIFDTQTDKQFTLKFKAADTTYSVNLRIYSESSKPVKNENKDEYYLETPIKVLTITLICQNPRKSPTFHIQHYYRLPKQNGSYATDKEYEDNMLHIGDDSELRANSETNTCFTPMLKSNRLNPNASKRRSQVDVLFVLIYKLAQLFPNRTETPSKLSDVAFIDNVRMTPFRLLRGELPFYQKYGMFSEGYKRLQEILPTVLWGEVKNETYYTYTGLKTIASMNALKAEQYTLTFENVIHKLTGKEFPDDTPIIEVMKHVPFELENKNNKELLEKYEGRNANTAEWLSKHYLSEQMLKTIALKHGFTEYQLYHENVLISIYTLTLDTNSKEWQYWSKTITFLSFEPMQSGGKRKTIKRRQKKQRHSRRN